MPDVYSELVKQACQAVSERRILEDTFRFVSVPSPTGDEAAFAGVLAGTLAGVGLDVGLDEEYPSSPSVVARLAGRGNGPTLQLDGHTDTVAVPHRECVIDLGARQVRGRGAADMKGGLAAICEALRVLRDVGIQPLGDVLVTAHGLHEAPIGDQRTLRSLLRRGIAGDAAVIAELGHDELATSSRGMSVFSIVIRREGSSVHEVELAQRTANPAWALRLLLDRLEERAAILDAESATGGPAHDSLFIGEVRAGDFYNRVPCDAEVVGTRRYRAPATLADIHGELNALCEGVAADSGLEVGFTLKEVGAAYALDPSEAVISAIRSGYRDAVGGDLPLASAQAVGNAADFAAFGVPAVYHGVNQRTAHSDDEYVDGSDLARAASVLAATIVHFCGAALDGL